MNKRAQIMVEHWNKFHWATSNLSNDDTWFLTAIGESIATIGVGSFTGNDLVYYDYTKVEIRCGSVVPLREESCC